MKYIRTKDGRIIDLKRKGLYNLPVYNFDTKENVLKAHQNQEDRDCCCIDNNIFYDYYYEDGTLCEYEIVKQADTIEELCDLFIIRTLTCKYSYLVFNKYEDVKNTCLGDRDLFGAIWTDKGLIYTAKMNDKGELELL